MRYGVFDYKFCWLLMIMIAEEKSCLVMFTLIVFERLNVAVFVVSLIQIETSCVE